MADLITRKPIEGWGESIEAIKRAVRDDAEALSLLDAELQRKRGAGKNQYTECQSNNVTEAPQGNEKEKALRRLRKDRPDLHQEVIDGTLSAHAAMVQAGFRRKTFTVVADDPERA